MKLTDAQRKALQASGELRSRKKKPEAPPPKAEPKPAPPPVIVKEKEKEDLMPVIVPAVGAEIVGAINNLVGKIDTMMKQQPKPEPARLPTPFKFTITRNRQGLMESCVAEPLTPKTKH